MITMKSVTGHELSPEGTTYLVNSYIESGDPFKTENGVYDSYWTPLYRGKPIIHMGKHVRIAGAFAPLLKMSNCIVYTKTQFPDAYEGDTIDFNESFTHKGFYWRPGVYRENDRGPKPINANK